MKEYIGNCLLQNKSEKILHCREPSKCKGEYLIYILLSLLFSRSNLVGMGIIPLQYLPGQNAETLGLTGYEMYDIVVPENSQPGQLITITTDDGKRFEVILRFDTEVDLTYYKHGGILNYMIRKML